ncbi:uncharacterized protein EV420DRAFT_1477578 [Desarmillaria tabescens]|uniref:Acetyl-CoA synthetase-like protein n=1 Tax=Armillaria tabescens TaxID=1929756 RepID=A0AA39NA51_ARMTA|nr:uncharacterized protein EV420DRAFT_1477578 [Desarmillaria tabescens]KAK0461856.1 hypothetical protein EV420DRAFT_1477578 [Desarmillaria tabescens]
MSFSEHRVIPPPPQKQGQQSRNFPPASNRWIPDRAANHSPNHRVFVYAREDGSLRNISWAEAVAAAYTCARLMNNRIPLKDKAPVVAVLSMSDTITYATTVMGLQRANCVVFPISPRNSAPAVAHLLYEVRVEHVLVGRDESMQVVSHEALDILKSRYPSVDLPQLSPIPIFEDLFLADWETRTNADDLPLLSVDPGAACLYLHSSGSTAYPKPIPLTFRRIIEHALVPWFGGRDLCDLVFAVHGLPIYHIMGLGAVLWAASSGIVLGVFEPRTPATSPTLDSMFASAMTMNSDIVFCVPIFLETLSREPEYIDWLSTRSGVIYGGGSLNREAGDHLASRWCSHFCCLRVKNEFSEPSVINTTVDGVDGFATSDLFTPHPTKPGYWKIIGHEPRTFGEYAQSGSACLSSCHVRAREISVGILVEPASQFSFDPVDENKLAEFRNMIWLTVKKMNQFAPQHSRLFKEMIIVTKPGQPFTYTAKNTVSPIPDNEDLFQYGCDSLPAVSLSLQATRIRNILFQALRDSADYDTHQISDDFVYSNPSITRLAKFLVSVVQGTHILGVGTASGLDAMHEMVQKYSKNFPTVPENQSWLEIDKIVLVTGTTGGLGCHILVNLVLDETVKHIYAVNRPGAVPVIKRQEQTFADHGLNVSMEKVTMLEADLSVETRVLDQATWRVDFNLGLSSFESNIRGLRNLIDLALVSQARLIYTSSIGVFQNAPADHPLAEAPINATVAQGTGYGESNSREDRRGTWKIKEWVPSMIQSSTVLGCLPDDDKFISWLPVHMAAQLLVDCIDIPTSIMHLVHPKPVIWSTLARIISDEVERQTRVIYTLATGVRNTLPWTRRNCRRSVYFRTTSTVRKIWD